MATFSHSALCLAEINFSCCYQRGESVIRFGAPKRGEGLLSGLVHRGRGGPVIRFGASEGGVSMLSGLVHPREEWAC